MGRDFDIRFPRFHIGPHDRIVIENRSYRLLQRTDEAFVLLPEDRSGLAETFRFEDLNRLTAAGRVRHEIGHFLPPAMRALGSLAPDLPPVSLLSPEQKGRAGRAPCTGRGLQGASCRR
jgi:putative transposase